MHSCKREAPHPWRTCSLSPLKQFSSKHFIHKRKKKKKRSILDKLEMFEKQPFPFVHFPLKKTEPTAVCWTSGENLINFEENIDRCEGKGFIFFLPPEKIGQSSSPFSCMNEQSRQSRWTKSFRLILWWPSLFHWFPADSLFAGHP